MLDGGAIFVHVSGYSSSIESMAWESGAELGVRNSDGRRNQTVTQTIYSSLATLIPGKQRQSQNVSLRLYRLTSTPVAGCANTHTAGMLPVGGEYGVFILLAVIYLQPKHQMAGASNNISSIRANISAWQFTASDRSCQKSAIIPAT